jgi:Uma2 family endonuclease
VASTSTRLMTFEEFEQMPWPDSVRYELRHGEVICLPPVKFGHMTIQEILRRLLSQAAGDAGTVYVEFGFRPKSEREYRVADVAYATKEHLARTNPQGYFEGSPELVVEVLSPSNTRAEIADKKKLGFETGCQEFWTVDTGHREIDVSTPNGSTITYKTGQEIPLFFGGSIPIDAIFSEVA